jgi:hypothetical protein
MLRQQPELHSLRIRCTRNLYREIGSRARSFSILVGPPELSRHIITPIPSPRASAFFESNGNHCTGGRSRSGRTAGRPALIPRRIDRMQSMYKVLGMISQR